MISRRFKQTEKYTALFILPFPASPPPPLQLAQLPPSPQSRSSRDPRIQIAQNRSSTPPSPALEIPVAILSSIYWGKENKIATACSSRYVLLVHLFLRERESPSPPPPLTNQQKGESRQTKVKEMLWCTWGSRLLYTYTCITFTIHIYVCHVYSAFIRVSRLLYRQTGITGYTFIVITHSSLTP